MRIVSFLDRMYYRCPQISLIWRIIRYGIRIFTNIYVRHFMTIHTKKTSVNNNCIILSLTSFPGRINNLWMTIATLLNQSYNNIHVVLWLSNGQFNGRKDLPKKLVNLEKKGLEIRFVDDDLRPHKKYFYAMQQYPDNDVITVDDDIIYHPDLVRALVESHHLHPDCVICNRGITISLNNYADWKHIEVIGEERSDILPTGVGGVYYPAHIFDNSPIFDKEAIKHTCLNGDDLWLNFMTRLNGHKVVYTGFKSGLVTILSSQNSALCNDNIKESHNDLQIQKITSWAKESLNCDFFVNIN
jgi:hypothetical protein